MDFSSGKGVVWGAGGSSLKMPCLRRVFASATTAPCAGKRVRCNDCAGKANSICAGGATAQRHCHCVCFIFTFLAEAGRGFQRWHDTGYSVIFI